MEKVEVKFGDWIEKGLNLYKENIGTLVLASIIVCALSTVTLGILAGPMFAGLAIITLAFFEKKKPEFGDVFQGFNFFLNSFLFVLVWGVLIFVVSFILGLIPCVGWLAAIFFVYAAQAFLIFGIFLIVDKNMDFWPASMESINIVKTNFWPFLGFSVVVSLMGAIGFLACGVGVIVTAPITICVLTIAYREIFGAGKVPVTTPKISDTEV